MSEQIPTPQIVNNDVPIVVFIGPASSGKSMILVRLAKYLRDQGYTIEADSTFLNTDKYREDCKEFKESLSTNIALPGSVNFTLAKVSKDGEDVAMLLEAPGEYFYSTSTPARNERLEPFLSAIMTSRNPKCFVILLSLDAETPSESFRNEGGHRRLYEERIINHFWPNMNRRGNRHILLYNKIDLTKYGTIHGCSNLKGARKDAQRFYEQLFLTMRRQVLGGLFKVDAFVFKTFCTGQFPKDVESNTRVYQPADDIYPRELWHEIMRKF